jgi:hypothetical protein
MTFRRLAVAAALWFGGVQAAQAAPIPCPTAPITYYLTSVTSCYQGSVKLFDFQAMLSLFSIEGGPSDVLVIPTGSPEPTPGRTGFTSFGFRFESIGPMPKQEPGPQEIWLDWTFRLRGRVYSIDDITASWSAAAHLLHSEAAFWGYGHEVIGGYGDGRGCSITRNEAISDASEIEGDEIIDRYIFGQYNPEVFTGPYYCEAIAPAFAHFNMQLGSDPGVDLHLARWDLSIDYTVIVTPEPASVTTVALGLLLLVGVRRRRGLTA